MDWRFQLLKKTGYSFYSKETSGKILEFIGTSGIGKTTLLNHTVARLKNRWLFGYCIDYLNRKDPPSEVDEVLMKILIRRMENIKNSDSFCPWHSLLDIRLSVNVMHEAMFIAQNVFPKGFVFADGLFRHFSAEILQVGDELPGQLWKNRAFVYLRARTPETAMTRFKSREMRAAQIGHGPQRGTAQDRVLSRVIQEQEMFQTIVEKALSFGCPVLVVDAEDSLQDSIKKVLEFESSLSLKFDMQQDTESNSQPLSLNR